MTVTVETRTKIVELIVGMVDAAPGAEILSELVEIVDSGISLGDLAIALANNPAFKVLYPDSLNNAAFAASFLSVLLASEVDATTLAATTTAMQADLDSGTHRGTAMFSVINTLAATPVTDASLGNAAQALTNKTEVANHYSVTKQQSAQTLEELKAVVTGVTSSATSLSDALENVNDLANKGTTFVLGLGTDTTTGTSLNDTFEAQINAQNPAANTLVAADTVDGKGGTDTLSIAASGTASNSLPAATATSIEVYSIQDTGSDNAGSYDFSVYSSETKIINNGSTNAAGVAFTNIGAGATFKIQANGDLTLAPVSFTMEGTTDAVLLNLHGGIKSLASITRNQTGAAEVTVSSTGAANTIGTLDLDTSTAIKKLTIDATTDLTTKLGADYNPNAEVFITGSAAFVDLDAAELSKNISLIDASGLNSGGVYLLVNQADTTAETKFIGGAGNDVLNLGGVNYSNKSITAAGGLGDDLLIMNASTALTADSAKNISGFETLSLIDNDDNSADSFNLSLLPEIEKITISTRGASDKISLTGLYPEQARNITITGNQNLETMTFTLLNASQAGQQDTLELKFDDGLAPSNTIFIKAIESVGTETLIVNAIDNVNIAQAFGLSTMTKLITAGAGAITLTTNAYDFNVNTVIDASGGTGTVTLDASGSKSNGFEYIGNAKVDTVSDNVIGGSILSTAGGKDVITLATKTGGVSGVVITGGLDADLIVAKAAEGNSASEVITLKFAFGDSVIDTSAVTGNAITGYSEALTDTITGLDLTTAASAGAGHVVTFDTETAATAVSFSSAAPVFGTTTVENAGDFYVFNTGSDGATFVYQDSDGDKIIENGEFGIQLVGALSTATVTGEFTIVTGNLLLSTLAG